MSIDLARNTTDLALGLAEEYRALADRGDVVLAAQARRTIEDLGLGSYTETPEGSASRGRWLIREDIRRAMGLA